MRYLFLFLISLSLLQLQANTEPDTLQLSPEDEDAFYLALYQNYLDSIAGTLDYSTGVVFLGNDLAKLTVPEGYHYVNSDEAEMILTDVWGNPPSIVPSLGMLFPIDGGLDAENGYGINITYADEGHIADDDAKDIDYDELLESLTTDFALESEAREEQGYGTVRMVGWGSAPYYDAAAKKLHWAMELNFDEMETNTLNYNIRVLGREGYLNLNAIGDMSVLPEIKDNIEEILMGVEFEPGQQYTDYRPGVDRLAAYGVGGLIAGKVLMKTGLLATIGIFLAKAWKLILIAIVGISAAIKKFLGR